MGTIHARLARLFMWWSASFSPGLLWGLRWVGWGLPQQERFLLRLFRGAAGCLLGGALARLLGWVFGSSLGTEDGCELIIRYPFVTN